MSPKGRKKLKKTHLDEVQQSVLTETATLPPKDVFQSLIEPMKVDDFFNNYWEKEPVVIEAKKPKCSTLNWFSKSLAADLLGKHPLQYIRDLHFCVFSEGKTKDLNKKGRITEKEFTNLLEKKSATAQIHQPQRFVESLWYVLERLECLFGCLVGSNVYITPKGAQGLAPHYDDVEVFIFQLEGEKHWRLYKPPVQLAREYKTNLDAKAIGEPTHEFVLKPGDVLYMPRGTVHQANTSTDATSHSTHITISTYQRHSLGDYLLESFPALIEEGLQNCLNLRRGLPPGFFLRSRPSNVTNVLRSSLESMLENVHQWNSVSTCSMIEDFMRSRLPPYLLDPQLLEESPSGKLPSLKSKVRLAYPDHVAFSVGEAVEDENSDEDEEESSTHDEQVLLLFTSLGNSRENHMIAAEAENDSASFNKTSALKFPLNFLEPLEQLITAEGNTFIEVKCLGSSISDDERLRLVTSLWVEHLLLIENS